MKKVFLIFSYSLLIEASLIIAQGTFEDNKKIIVNPERIFENFNLSHVEKVIKYKNKYYVLEPMNHRILVFDELLKLVRQISHIGQGRGELYHPTDFVIRENLLYTHEIINNRVQIFNLDGEYVSGFDNDYKAYGIAVNSKGEIYLGQPQRGKLISVYNQNGEFLRSFGNLKKISDFYGEPLKGIDIRYRLAINRVNICIDEEENLYLSFVGAPFFQKYDKDGKLLFEKRIQSPFAEEIIKEFRIKGKSPARSAIDNVPTPLITTYMTVDSKNGYLIISFQWDRGWIYVANTEGERIALLEPADKEMLFGKISISKDSILFCSRLSVVKYNEAYKIDFKKNLKGGDLK